jgi:hypothetical protein
MTDMIWTAGYRTALINPYIPFAFREMRGFDDQTVRQVLRMAGGGEAFRVRLSNYHGREALTVGAATAAAGDRRSAGHPHLRRRRAAGHSRGCGGRQ